MNKTKIEWVKNPDGTQGFTSNPISGICPVQCKLPDGTIYCYGRNFYKRFKNNKWFENERPMFWLHRLAKIQKRKKPAGIFMCSTFELFHPITYGFYRDNIFKTIEACPQHRFYILTKFPRNIDRLMPKNVWLGTSITGDDDQWIKGFDLYQQEAKIKFISFEPLLQPIKILGEIMNFDWIIIGRLTQHGHKYDPKKEWIEEIVDECRNFGVPVFLKDNLRAIWGNNLIQEFPHRGER